MKDLLKGFNITGKVIKSLDGYGSSNFLIEDEKKSLYVLKQYDAQEKELINEEIEFIQKMSDHLDIQLPVPIKHENQSLISSSNNKVLRLSPFLKGRFLAEAEHSESLIKNFGKTVGLIHKISKQNPSWSSEFPHIKSRYTIWDLMNAFDNKCSFIKEAEHRKIVEYYLLEFKEDALAKLRSLPKYIIHNDLNEWNVLTQENRISGLIDFGDIVYSPLINDIAIALAYLLFNKEDIIKTVSIFLKGYCSVTHLSVEEVELLHCLIPARLCTSVCNSAKAKLESKDTSYILISEKPAWDLLLKWLRINKVSANRAWRDAADLIPKNIDVSLSEILTKRQLYSSSALSLSYTNPIYFDSAVFQYMKDKQGNTYLDAYNNIPHIGHSHPRLSKVAAQEFRRLNTNTRYVYDAYTNYAEKLLTYFPEKLNKVFFVNSGSAASDLAVRLARNYTGQDCLLVLEHGYHGNTNLGINISSYKFDGKGGKGPVSSIIKLPLPKFYNGKFNNAKDYVEEAISIIKENISNGRYPSAMIVECISGCGGQVPLIPGYLTKLKEFLSQHNILLIADEVQTGFGRTGKNFWAFQSHGVIPDITVLGKPMGNGHPIGAVVTTSEIAERFNNGMEFFSSFGGNPISCKIGQTVLDVIDEEGLQSNSKVVGDYYIENLNSLKKDFSSIGNVRGEGLFIGIELIKPHSNNPNTELAQKVKNGMKNNFILTSTDGPFDNVIKSKPPLCFTKRNVDEVIDRLAQNLRGFNAE